MKLKNIFVAVTVTLIAMAAPAGAQIKCKAKQDKKTGAIGYSFVNKAGGTVVYSYSDPAEFINAGQTNWRVFANEDTCQTGGKGRNCLVSNDAAEAAIAPASCKIYMGDVASGETCELYIKGCQPAQRPAPSTGWFGFRGCLPTDPCYSAAWDADTGISWYISPDNQARSLDDHETYLADVLNGGKSDGIDYACHTDGCDLQLPTLAQLKKLGADCASVAELSVSIVNAIWIYTGAQADLCTALWPDPTLGEPTNCAWSSTVDASDPTQAHAVCLVESGLGERTSSLLVIVASAPLPQASLLPTGTVHLANYGRITW